MNSTSHLLFIVIILFLACQCFFFSKGKDLAIKNIEAVMPALLADDFRCHLGSTTDDNLYDAPFKKERTIQERAGNLFTHLHNFLKNNNFTHSDIALRITAPSDLYTTIETGNEFIIHPENSLKKHYTLQEKGSILTVFFKYNWKDGWTALLCPANLYCSSFLILLSAIGIYLLKKRRTQTDEIVTSQPTLPTLYTTKNIYILPDGSTFNANEHTLVNGNETFKLRKQLSLLLWAFMESPDFRLHANAIDQLFWKKNNCTDNRARLISDLRKELKQHTQCSILLVNKHDYLLK